MKLNSNPFSLFDFIGYFLPGFFLIKTCMLINWVNYPLLSDNIIISSYEKSVHTLNNTNDDFNIIYFIIISYLLGQILTFLSSVTIEKFGIWNYSYPSKSLLKTSKNIKDHKEKDNNYKRKLKIMMKIILLPLFLTDYIFSEKLKFKIYHNRPFNENMVTVIKKKIYYLYNNKIFNNKDECEAILEINGNETEYFQPLYHLLISSSESHSNKTKNYVALYGLMRNLTFIIIIPYWLIILSLSTNFKNNIEFIKEYIYHNPIHSIFLIIGYLIITYILFWSYLKYYRRFSSEVLYGILTINHENEKTIIKRKLNWKEFK